MLKHNLRVHEACGRLARRSLCGSITAGLSALVVTR